VPGVCRELDIEALACYLAYLYVPHPQRQPPSRTRRNSGIALRRLSSVIASCSACCCSYSRAGCRRAIRAGARC
jgi:hypothetical protein